MEEWANIANYPGYFVSTEGRVRGARGHVLRPSKGKYLQVALSKGSERQAARVHRLVASAFLGGNPDGMVVNHKNGQKHDNRLANLEIVTLGQNHAHAFATGLRRPHPNFVRPRRGESNPGALLTNEQVAAIRERLMHHKHGLSRQIAKEYGVTDSTISSIKRGKNWRGITQQQPLPR
jgi:hypothetical protein